MEIRLSENDKYTSEELQEMLKDTGLVELDQKEL
jgi:hypothetical protein